ncbi:hypothetical protein [Polaromonas sp.]|uniref:hypothetical protein n=1 Tax=Polaromonas sp. TaxID=1869339 RepID=UPI0037535FF3
MKNEDGARVHIRVLGAPGTGKTQLAAELTTALPSENPALLFAVDDNPALPLPRHGSHACVTLLMGLDLPAPDALMAAQQAADWALRDALAFSGVNYQVVYGLGEQRLRSALSALQVGLPRASRAAEADSSRGRWVWTCDNCSDPQCERRLLSDLLAAREGSAGAP